MIGCSVCISEQVLYMALNSNSKAKKISTLKPTTAKKTSVSVRSKTQKEELKGQKASSKKTIAKE